MKKEMKEYIFVRCIGFRQMTQRKRLLNVLQLAAYALVLYESMPLLLHESFKPAACSLVIIASIGLHLMKRGQAANIIEFGLDISYIILLTMTIKDGSIAVFFSILIHLLRIPSCYTDEKLKRLYGYPHFSPLYMAVELKKDNDLAYSVKNDYDEIMEDNIVRFSSAVCRCDVKLQAMMIISAVIICVGTVIFHCGMDERREYNNAVSVDSIVSCYDGEAVRGTVYQIYEQASSTFEKNLPEEFWGEFGGKLIRFSVPYPYKESFEELCNDSLSRFDDDYDDSNAASVASNGIAFRGKYVKADEQRTLLSTPKENFGDDIPDVVEDHIIKLIDKEKSNSKISMGIMIIALGISGLLLVILFVFRKLDDLDTTIQ